MPASTSQSYIKGQLNRLHWELYIVMANVYCWIIGRRIETCHEGIKSSKPLTKIALYEHGQKGILG